MAKFYPIIFVHGWGGPGDIVRDFGAADEQGGGRAIASGFKMSPLIERTRVMTMEDQVTGR